MTGRDVDGGSRSRLKDMDGCGWLQLRNMEREVEYRLNNEGMHDRGILSNTYDEC